MFRIFITAIIAFLSLSANSGVQEFQLENGLKILVQEDHRAPVVVSMIWYKVGSADEVGGSTGLSHALEHIMFKGTKKYPAGEFSKIIASLGGEENAFTSYDYTAYYEKISNKSLAKCFELEADRMENLSLNKNDFEQEIKVVQEERRLRTDDNPKALANERFLATAHLSPSYQHPVIGWMSDLLQMRVDELREWYLRYYTPDNATLVVVGDVNANSVFELAKKYFGPIKKGIPFTRKDKVEPVGLGKKTVEVHTNAKVPMLLMGYNTPSVMANDNSKDPYVIEIIAALLDASDNGRLTKELINKQQLASNVSIAYNPYSRYQTQFAFYAIPKSKVTMSEVKNGFLNEIERLKKEKVTPVELQRVKTQIIAQKTFERDSMFNQAAELGLLETIGIGWTGAKSYISNINAVTPDDILKTANTFFQNNSLTETYLIPDNN